MSFIYKNTATGESKEFDASNLPSEGWEFVDRIQEEVETNKVYEYSIEGETETETTYLYYDDGSGDEPIELTTEDTIDGGVEDDWTLIDTKVKKQTAKSDITETLLSDPNYSLMFIAHKMKDTDKSAFSTKVGMLAEAAKAKGLNAYAVVGTADPDDIKAFKESIQLVAAPRNSCIFTCDLYGELKWQYLRCTFK